MPQSLEDPRPPGRGRNLKSQCRGGRARHPPWPPSPAEATFGVDRKVTGHRSRRMPFPIPSPGLSSRHVFSKITTLFTDRCSLPSRCDGEQNKGSPWPRGAQGRQGTLEPHAVSAWRGGTRHHVLGYQIPPKSGKASQNRTEQIWAAAHLPLRSSCPRNPHKEMPRGRSTGPVGGPAVLRPLGGLVSPGAGTMTHARKVPGPQHVS